jgi:hypothetical protein
VLLAHLEVPSVKLNGSVEVLYSHSDVIYAPEQHPAAEYIGR